MTCRTAIPPPRQFRQIRGRTGAFPDQQQHVAMLREKLVEPRRASADPAILDHRVRRAVAGMRAGRADGVILDDRAMPVIDRNPGDRLAELFDH